MYKTVNDIICYNQSYRTVSIALINLESFWKKLVVVLGMVSLPWHICG